MIKRMIEIYPLDMDNVININSANKDFVCENGKVYMIDEASGSSYNITIPKTTKRCFIKAHSPYHNEVYNIDFGKDRVIKYFYNIGEVASPSASYSRMYIDDGLGMTASSDYDVNISILVNNDTVDVTFSSIME